MLVSTARFGLMRSIQASASETLTAVGAAVLGVVLCAAPAYLAARGVPEIPHDLIARGHNCLLLRFPGSREYFWTFATHDGPLKLTVGVESEYKLELQVLDPRGEVVARGVSDMTACMVSLPSCSPRRGEVMC